MWEEELTGGPSVAVRERKGRWEWAGLGREKRGERFRGFGEFSFLQTFEIELFFKL
jgi:hypothetical protein